MLTELQKINKLKLKYKLSIGAFFRNEAPYLKEWLNHYLNRGVNHFYLINDFSEDNFLEVLKPYEKYITLFNNKNSKIITSKQVACYNRFLIPILNETKWILICDIDEYIWNPSTLSIQNALDILEKNGSSYYEIDMILFGSNNYIKQPKCIVNSFTKRQKFPFYRKIDNKIKIINNDKKEIVLSKVVEKFGIHKHFHKKLTIEKQINFKNLPLIGNHYKLQSREKWTQQKLKNPDPNGWKLSKEEFHLSISPNMPIPYERSGVSPLNYRNEEMFDISNECQNKVEDLDLVKQNIKYNVNFMPNSTTVVRFTVNEDVLGSNPS